MRSKLWGVLCATVISAMLFLCACQQTPETEIITSKNDGAFDANSVVSATEHNDPTATLEVHHEDTFLSTDGRVEFSVKIDNYVSAADMPIFEVVPHYITEEDAKRVAYALFGNVEYYEAEAMLDPVYSKSEIQKKINRWSQYINQTAFSELYGEYSENTVNIIKKFISDYTEDYESAPVDNPHVLCQWQFKKIPYYYLPKAEINALDLDRENDGVQAALLLDGIPYRFNAETRNKDDYKVNYINAYIYDGISPDFIDSRIFRADLCRTEKPTDAQISMVKALAERMLTEMELGDWMVDECYISTISYGNAAEYTICINAVPVLNGTKVLRQPQLLSLTSEDTYASNYNMTDASFQFSANGDLLNFVLYSPIDIANVVNDNVAVMNIDDLLEKGKTYLEHSDFSQYDSNMLFNPEDENIACSVSVNKIEYALSRIRVPNTEASYYYIPSLAFYGDVFLPINLMGKSIM